MTLHSERRFGQHVWYVWRDKVTRKLSVEKGIVEAILFTDCGKDEPIIEYLVGVNTYRVSQYLYDTKQEAEQAMNTIK